MDQQALPDVAVVLTLDPQNAPAPNDDPHRSCENCGRASRPVTRRTMLMMLKPDLFDRVTEAEYRFCSNPGCDVVYFTEGEGPAFATSDLRLRVGLKATEDPIQLCYCFGFFEADLRQEIAQTGHTAIPQRIAALLKQGMCSCPTRNPSGACCLGEVTKTTKRLLGGAGAAD